MGGGPPHTLRAPPLPPSRLLPSPLQALCHSPGGPEEGIRLASPQREAAPGNQEEAGRWCKVGFWAHPRPHQPAPCRGTRGTGEGGGAWQVGTFAASAAAGTTAIDQGALDLGALIERPSGLCFLLGFPPPESEFLLVEGQCPHLSQVRVTPCAHFWNREKRAGRPPAHPGKN